MKNSKYTNLPPPDVKFSEQALAKVQQLLPTRLLSTAMFKLANLDHPLVAQPLIRAFARNFKIDMSQAINEQVSDYASFASFFTREIKPDLRPLSKDPLALASPVDGTISQSGAIRGGQLIQAKGVSYSVAELLGSTALADQFSKGSFSTIYLSPRDYHRVHMPLTGRLVSWTYLPGRLFSVNAATVRALPGVFVRNERVAAVFETEHGLMALVLVGALCVGGIETVWSGPICPPHIQDQPMVHKPNVPVQLQRGAEMGRFNLGSTVILLMATPDLAWHVTEAGRSVRMGETLGQISAPSAPVIDAVQAPQAEISPAPEVKSAEAPAPSAKKKPASKDTAADAVDESSAEASPSKPSRPARAASKSSSRKKTPK